MRHRFCQGDQPCLFSTPQQRGAGQASAATFGCERLLRIVPLLQRVEGNFAPSVPDVCDRAKTECARKTHTDYTLEWNTESCNCFGDLQCPLPCCSLNAWTRKLNALRWSTYLAGVHCSLFFFHRILDSPYFTPCWEVYLTENRDA